MGDRVSIQFQNSDEKSVVLFSRWDGMDFVEMAEIYVNKLKEWIKEQGNTTRTPLIRLEPNTVMVDFIRYFTEGQERIDGNYYLGATEDDGDNSDNGHHLINLVSRMEKSQNGD